MAISGYLTTRGFDEYLERVNRAGRDVDGAAARALLAGANVLLPGMKRRVRKDTRNLENHLIIDGPYQDGNYHFLEVGLVGADATTARYGNVQEYGSVSVSPQSYIRATLDNDKSKARRAIKESLIADGAI